MKTFHRNRLLPILLAVFVWAATAMAQTPAALTAPSGSPVALSVEARARLHAQIAAVAREQAALSPAQRKLASPLLYAAKEVATASPAVAGAPKLRSNTVLETDGRVRVKMKADVTPELLASIKALGGTVTQSYPKYRTLYATLPLGSLETLAARSEVEFIDVPPTVDYNRPGKPRAATGQRVAPVTNDATTPNDPEGDAVHGTATVRAQYGATGQGIKVGVISDTLDNAQGAYQNAVLNGYVSTVTAVPGQAGDSTTGEAEGLAMLEVVHRLVPNAQLFFCHRQQRRGTDGRKHQRPGGGRLHRHHRRHFLLRRVALPGRRRRAGIQRRERAGRAVFLLRGQLRQPGQRHLQLLGGRFQGCHAGPDDPRLPARRRGRVAGTELRRQPGQRPGERVPVLERADGRGHLRLHPVRNRRIR